MTDHSPTKTETKPPVVTPMPRDESAATGIPATVDESAAAVTPPDSNEPAASDIPGPENESAAEVAIVPGSAPGSDKDEILAEFWETVKRLPSYVRLATLMARDPQVPRSSKALLVAGTAYTVTPIDFVPGVIPVAGQLDDLYVLLTALRQAIRACPDEIVEAHLTATGVTAASIDADLALVRKMVRRGVAWTVRNGGKALKGATRYASARIREWRAAPGRGGS